MIETRRLENVIIMLFLKQQVLKRTRAQTLTQWAFTYSKLTIKTLEQGVKYVQSQQ